MKGRVKQTGTWRCVFSQYPFRSGANLFWCFWASHSCSRSLPAAYACITGQNPLHGEKREENLSATNWNKKDGKPPETAYLEEANSELEETTYQLVRFVHPTVGLLGGPRGPFDDGPNGLQAPSMPWWLPARPFTVVGCMCHLDTKLFRCRWFGCAKFVSFTLPKPDQEQTGR